MTDVPVVASYDLHANVSAANVELVNAYIGYRTNPHLDMRERGAESAQMMRRLLAGTQDRISRASACRSCRRPSACSPARTRTNGPMAS